jgi:oligoendopeptidase F
VLEFEKSLDLKIERVYHYASLQLAEDSQQRILGADWAGSEPAHKDRRNVGVSCPEILAIDDETLPIRCRSSLAEWRIKLRKIRRMKPHVLGARGTPSRIG